jgi:tetratricopeptide (TPR) repeat protein
MNVKSLRFVAAALLAFLLVSAVAQALPAASIKDGESGESMAKIIVKAASNAEKCVTAMVDRIKANSTIIELINGSDLKDAFWGNVSLIDDGSALLDEAEADLEAGNYTDAMNEAMEAMKIFKDVWVNIHQILRELGITEIEAEGKPEVQAQGLLVAINRTLERIERIEKLIEDVQALMINARSLLNMTEVKALLAEGNVSEVAHRLAEANHLIAQAYKMLKAKAEAKMAERMERFRERVMERLEAMAGKLNETALKEIMEDMSFRSMGEFRQWLNTLINETKEHAKAGEMGLALGKLKNLDEKFKGFARRFTAKTVPPEAQEENPALEVSVEKRTLRNQVILRVTVNNTGNCDVVFPNAALGLVIEKKVSGEWVPHYRPVSAQVLVKLEPGESREITIKIVKPDEGVYRATVSGWSKITLKPVAATSIEFNMP